MVTFSVLLANSNFMISTTYGMLYLSVDSRPASLIASSYFFLYFEILNTNLTYIN